MAMKRPNGSGSIYKLPGKRRRPYAVRIFDGIELKEDGNGKVKYKYLGYFEKQTEALQFLEKYNSSPVTVAKPKQENNKHKFSEIYNLYIEELQKTKELSRQSYDSRKAAFKHLKPLHNMVFETITIDDLENVVHKLSRLSPSSISNIRIVLKGMYKTAMRHKYVSEDVSALMITMSNNENANPHKPFTDEEIDLLWKHTDIKEVRLFLILIYTGMRINELLTMKSENVHLSERYIVGGLKTEAGKDRMIPLSEKIIPFLDTSNEYLITNNNKKYNYSKAKNDAKEALKSLGLDHSFHDARHTCASLMERAKVDLLHRKLILGHKSADITDHYTHVPIEDLIDDINRI